jgi:hypothetical protein
MTEEVQVPAGEQPVPGQVATAAPDTEVKTPDVVEDQQEKPARTFTQEELDAAISKRLAREQRKWERDQAARAAVAQVPQTPKDLPPADQFESQDAYVEALAARKAQELVAKQTQARERSAIESAYEARVETALDRYPDFEQVAYSQNHPVTDIMAEAIQSSDVGPDIAYWLGSNPKEAVRIARLTPTLQAKEIGVIEAKLVAAPPEKKTTSAPAPITPVTARASGSPSFDTTDPRSIKSLSTSEWIEAERQRQVRKLQAQRN